MKLSRGLRAVLPPAPISLWDGHLIRGADLFHDALDKEVEDLELAVEGFDEHLIGFNPHDDLWKHVVPADDITQLRWET
jgi:hypothetical protein